MGFLQEGPTSSSISQPQFETLSLLVFPSTPGQAQKNDPLKSRQQVDLERAHFLVTQAFEEDEKGNDDEAVELYTQAVELCINTVRVSLCWIFRISHKVSGCSHSCFSLCLNSPTRRQTRRCRPN